MKKWIGAALLAMVVGCGCDDLNTAPPDPYIPPPEIKGPAPAATRPLSKDFMREILAFTEHYHDMMAEQRDELLKYPIRPDDNEQLKGKRSLFLSNTAQWRNDLMIRQEWLRQKQVPAEHPAHEIDVAIYYLMDEMRHLDLVFHNNEMHDTKYADKYADQIVKAREALEKYTDPPKDPQ